MTETECGQVVTNLAFGGFLAVLIVGWHIFKQK